MQRTREVGEKHNDNLVVVVVVVEEGRKSRLEKPCQSPL